MTSFDYRAIHAQEDSKQRILSDQARMNIAFYHIMWEIHKRIIQGKFSYTCRIPDKGLPAKNIAHIRNHLMLLGFKVQEKDTNIWKISWEERHSTV